MTQLHPLVEYARAMGSDATTVRDAAHEACHALETGALDWEREAIHEAILEKTDGERSWMLALEVRARAVEALVCKELGVQYIEDKWLHVAFMETVKTLGAAIPTNFFTKGVAIAKESPEVVALAKKIATLKLEE